MNLQERKRLLIELGNYMIANGDEWKAAKEQAFMANKWFIPEFIDRASNNIAGQYLQPAALEKLIDLYRLPEENIISKIIGIVMAGNIPLVGFHDFLCAFISGHRLKIKPSSKDEVLLKHLTQVMTGWNREVESIISFQEPIKNCDAYIATGSNNTSHYFEYYFRKYPHVIRKNRTSVAVLSGNESGEELENLADDIHLYFGFGCRNVTKIFVPKDYDFVALLEASKKYDWMMNHNGYKNNYDYGLAVQIINNRFYMSSGNLLLVEQASVFSPVAQLHYEFINAPETLAKLGADDNIQCVISSNATGFGKAQVPGICDFADGVDTHEIFAGTLRKMKELRTSKYEDLSKQNVKLKLLALFIA